MPNIGTPLLLRLQPDLWSKNSSPKSIQLLSNTTTMSFNPRRTGGLGFGLSSAYWIKFTYVSAVRVRAAIRCVTMGEVKQAPHRTVTRRSDELKLEIGQTISLEEGLVGVVLARYTRSGDARHDVHYIVELRQGADERR